MKTETVSFRVIHNKDQEFLFQLYASTRAQEMAQVPWDNQAKDEFLRSQFKAQTEGYSATYLRAVHRIIQVGESDIGRMIVDRQDECLRLIDLSIAPFWRRRGIGTGIVQSLMQEADGGKVPMRLAVFTFSPALALYTRLGFRKIGEMPHRSEMEWRPPSLGQLKTTS
ncbi:Acetyltransferase, GNAT family [Candidatus Rhodobacter oscarellae]|uniref:Acetyltransferase, GNAT family n=1 Tax=Candidatus Rhodobacter oscarellae TaxID=1675527 RepID=A0A0J9E434_9RHOB|nr:GNAT family N-acetyltransferase [Candidatus Rhodobacter lobularis]KMW57530.1 Acetyltransferase, GNAT family [Candidatus Rhodobacter lobularis]